MTAPRRRWSRFSLRTLFVVVTVLGCWLGWNAALVQKRRPFIQRAEVSGDWILVTFDDLRSGGMTKVGSASDFSDEERRQSWKSQLLSLGLPLFGQKSYAVVLVPCTEPEGASVAKMQPTVEAFPEASVGMMSPVGCWLVSGPLMSENAAEVVP